GDRVDTLALAGSSEHGHPRSNTNMNGWASSYEPSVRTACSKTKVAPRKLRSPELNVRWLGRMDFARALALQEEIVSEKRHDSSAEDQLLLLEHEPVYTIGRTPDRSSLFATGQIHRGEPGAAHLQHPLFVINRGGQATYHGPGQLIGYPIIDLRGH